VFSRSEQPRQDTFWRFWITSLLCGYTSALLTYLSAKYLKNTSGTHLEIFFLNLYYHENPNWIAIENIC
jgi:hypothetical protein